MREYNVLNSPQHCELTPLVKHLDSEHMQMAMSEGECCSRQRVM